MPDDGRAQEIEADQVIAQVGAKVGCNGFRDLDGRKLDRTLPEHVAGERRSCDAAALPAVQERFDLPVALHPLGETGPARALARAEHRSHQRKNAGRLDEHPRCPVRQMPPVQFGQSPFEIIVHQRDGEVAGSFDDANAQRGQRGAELLCALHVERFNAHTKFLEFALCAVGR
jgi:hypothetical protein